VFEKLHPFFKVHCKSGEEEVTSRTVGAQRDNAVGRQPQEEDSQNGEGVSTSEAEHSVAPRECCWTSALSHKKFEAERRDTF